MWKLFWKSSIALGDIASWNVLMFLKLVTKWREIQKSKLNNSLTNWTFQKNCSHSNLSRRAFLKLFICFFFEGPGGLPYKSDGDAPRSIVLSLWGVNCRYWSHLGCSGCKVTTPCPFRYCLVPCIKKFTKNVLTLTTQKSPLGPGLV